MTPPAADASTSCLVAGYTVPFLLFFDFRCTKDLNDSYTELSEKINERLREVTIIRKPGELQI
jgi:hypothetical protein